MDNAAAPSASLKGLASRLQSMDDTNQLQTLLAAAIKAEDYTLAARVRDRLKHVRWWWGVEGGMRGAAPSTHACMLLMLRGLHPPSRPTNLCHVHTCRGTPCSTQTLASMEAGWQRAQPCMATATCMHVCIGILLLRAGHRWLSITHRLGRAGRARVAGRSCTALGLQVPHRCAAPRRWIHRLQAQGQIWRAGEGGGGKQRQREASATAATDSLPCVHDRVK